MPNLTLDKPLDNNSKPIKVGSSIVPLEVSEDKLWYQKTPTDQYEVANKKYVDDNAGGGISVDKFFYTSSFYHGGNNSEYIPIAGGSTTELSSLSDTGNDDSNFICPYDLKINTIYVNATKSRNTDEDADNTSLRLYKNGSALSNAITVNMATIGYDSTDIYTVYTFDFSGETNTYSAGEIMQILIDPTNKIYYVTATIVGEYT
tara:strand:- start:84 stop:695 length:612 start_codon:yes stop_codon:yes gene_type:complete